MFAVAGLCFFLQIRFAKVNGAIVIAFVALDQSLNEPYVIGTKHQQVQILAPSDWSRVGLSPAVVLRAPGVERLRIAFMTKAQWADDPMRIDVPYVDLQDRQRGQYGVFVARPPEPLPIGDVVVRADDISGQLSSGWSGMICDPDANQGMLGEQGGAIPLVRKIIFLASDSDQPDRVPSSETVPIAETDLSGILLSRHNGSFTKCVIRPAERYEISKCQVADEFFWGEADCDIDYMRARAQWVCPETYLLASEAALVNLRVGFVMPRPAAIWGDSLTSPWRDYHAMLTQASGFIATPDGFFFSDMLRDNALSVGSSAFHFCGPYHFNYGHWMTEYLTSLWLMRGPIEAGQIVPISPPLNSWQRDSIRAIGIDPARIRSCEEEYVACDNVISHSLFRLTSGWGTSPQGDALSPRPRIDRLITWGWGSAFLDMIRDLQRRSTAAKSMAGPERLYLDRSGLDHPRQMTNGAELATRLAAEGFAVVKPETLSLTEEVGLFARARVIVGQQGSGLINMAFAPRGCHVIEIMTDGYVYEHFRWLAALLGHRYSRLVVHIDPNVSPIFTRVNFRAPIEQVMSVART